MTKDKQKATQAFAFGKPEITVYSRKTERIDQNQLQTRRK